MWRESIGRAVNANASSQRAFRVSPAALIPHSQSWRRASRYAHPPWPLPWTRRQQCQLKWRGGARRGSQAGPGKRAERHMTEQRGKRGQGSEPVIAQAERREAEQMAGATKGISGDARNRQINRQPSREPPLQDCEFGPHRPSYAFDEMRGADGALTAGALSQNCRTHR